MSALILAGVLAVMSTHPEVESAWRSLAVADLKDIRRLLEENHPGPVDTENRLYAQRLEANYAPAMAHAAAAKNFFDYKRALLSYTNRFRDGHTAAYFTLGSVSGFSWPGFAVHRDERGSFRIKEVESDVDLMNGDELLSCDGITVDALMKERIDPFYWNVDIPHERWLHLGRLFVLETGDDAATLRTCRLRTGSGDKEVALKWRPINREKADRLRTRPNFGSIPELRKIGDIWHVVLPTFHYQTPEDEARIKKLLADISSNAEAMRRGKVLLDVRGNGGGSSAWGSEIAKALWGDAWVSRVEDSFDWTVDWRASSSNLKMLESTVARYESSGLADRAADIRKIRDAVATAVKDGTPLVRIPSPAQPSSASPPNNPLTGRVYLLTDGACASACLDFVDVVRRMPNATQIGWSTSADAIYIDNSNAKLPSGLAGFSYSMKVYRNRIRGHNQWYEPQIKWPGGAVTDESLRNWIESLK